MTQSCSPAVKSCTGGFPQQRRPYKLLISGARYAVEVFVISLGDPDDRSCDQAGRLGSAEVCNAQDIRGPCVVSIERRLTPRQCAICQDRGLSSPTRGCRFLAEDHRLDVAAWLRDLGLERYVSAFRDNDIDTEVLPKLTAEDLISIGVSSVGHRRCCSTPSLRSAPRIPPPQ